MTSDFSWGQSFAARFRTPEQRNAAIAVVLVVAVVIVLGFGSGLALLSSDDGGGLAPVRRGAAAGVLDVSNPSLPVSADPVLASAARAIGASSITRAATVAGAGGSRLSQTGSASSSAAPAAACEGESIAAAMATPFWIHFEKAHLEASPGQQVADILDLDQYTKTHTVLFEHMLSPLAGLLMASGGAVDPFWVHFEKAHLEESPGQQAADILDIDQYVLTHTVLVEHMAAPMSDGMTKAGC